MKTAAEKMMDAFRSYCLNVQPKDIEEIENELRYEGYLAEESAVFQERVLTLFGEVVVGGIIVDFKEFRKEVNLKGEWKEEMGWIGKWAALDYSVKRKQYYLTNLIHPDLVFQEIKKKNEELLFLEDKLAEEQRNKYELTKLFHPEAAEQMLVQEIRQQFAQLRQSTMENQKMKELTNRIETLAFEMYEEYIQ